MSKKIKNLTEQYKLYITKGIGFANNGDLNKAENFFLTAIKINKAEHLAYINLSNIYILQKKYNKCKKLLLNYLTEYKLNEDLVNYTTKIFYNYKFNKELKELFSITKLNSKNYKKEKQYLFFTQGKYFERDKNIPDAISAYLKSILCNKFYFESYVKLFGLYEKTNEIKKLKTIINESFKHFNVKDQINIIALYKSILLNREKKFKQSQLNISKYNLNLEFKNNKQFLSRLLDLESKNFEKLKKYSLAYQKVKDRNALLKNLDQNEKYNSNNILDSISKYKKIYNKNNVKYINKNLYYPDDSKLVFLVGFPRSGTTLLDTILRSHTKIKVLEEKPYILNLRHDYFKKNDNNLSKILKITQKEKDYIRSSYYKQIISKPSDVNKTIIDKFPLSIIELGFIKCIFPNSKIILAMRHPCDVVTSCFFSLFKINDAMVNFLKWDDTIYFYNKVFDLFNFYEEELNIDYRMIKYENIVNDFKKHINLLLDYLDLKYERKIEKFFITAKNRNKISTPSYSQVINPLYKSSIGRWKNYDSAIKSQKDLKRWIKKFNY